MKHSRFKIFSVCLFVILFVYIILRSILVEPIHDEVATLFHYIDYGTIWGSDTVIDANNHLLNSFLGKVCYSIFGDHFWAVRLPNVLSFCLFFYAVYKLANLLNKEFLKYVFVIAFTCIPYILDYFAYVRGYGMSMALFFMAFYHFLKLNTEYTWKRMTLMSLLLLLSIYANLNLISSLLLIFGYLGLKLIFESVKLKRYKTLYGFMIISFITAVCLLPSMYFAHLLKINNALYYGNKDGLWGTTGKTLSENVLMTDSIIIKYVLIVFLIGIIFHLFYVIKKFGFHSFFQSNDTMFAGLFLGNLIAIELMYLILDMNFPEDRVGMVLIFLFIGTVLFILQSYNSIKWTGMIFFIFPIVGVKHFNFVTSVFSPADRMEKPYFERILKSIDNDKTFSLYFLQTLTYAYHVRKQSPTNFFVPSLFNSSHQYVEDMASDKGGLSKLSRAGYKVLFYNERTTHSFLEKTNKENWQLVQSIDTAHITLNGMYYDLINSGTTIDMDGKYRFVFDLELNTPVLRRETVVLVTDCNYKTGENYYYGFNLNWAAGKNRHYKFRRIVDWDSSKDKNLALYLYNPNELNYEILKESVKVYKAK